MKDFIEELSSLTVVFMKAFLNHYAMDILANLANFTNPIKNLVASDVGLASFHEDQFHNHTNISC